MIWSKRAIFRPTTYHKPQCFIDLLDASAEKRVNYSDSTKQVSSKYVRMGSTWKVAFFAFPFKVSISASTELGFALMPGELIR